MNTLLSLRSELMELCELGTISAVRSKQEPFICTMITTAYAAVSRRHILALTGRSFRDRESNWSPNRAQTHRPLALLEQ